MVWISCAVGMRNAILRNHLESQMCSVLIFITFRYTFHFKNTQLKATKVFRAVLRGILTGSKMCSFFIFSAWLLIGWFTKRLGDGLCSHCKNLMIMFCCSCSCSQWLIKTRFGDGLCSRCKNSILRLYSSCSIALVLVLMPKNCNKWKFLKFWLWLTWLAQHAWLTPWLPWLAGSQIYKTQKTSEKASLRGAIFSMEQPSVVAGTFAPSFSLNFLSFFVYI